MFQLFDLLVLKLRISANIERISQIKYNYYKPYVSSRRN